jgi:predicted metallopeptidase
MSVTYTDAPVVKEIAQGLIPQHHPHLEGARIEYVFRSKRLTSNGKIVAGKARKVTGLNAFLATKPPAFGGLPFFVIEIAQDVWDALPRPQQVALVDHELCHCFREIDDDTGEWELSIRPHDVEEFAEIVYRHGLWSQDLDHFVTNSKQLRLTS